MKSPSFFIKIVSENLITIEADGYSRQIFQPYIKDGKITIYNLIPCKKEPATKVYAGNRTIFGDLTNSFNGPKIQILQNITLDPSNSIDHILKDIKTENISQNEENHCPSFSQSNSTIEQKFNHIDMPPPPSTPLKRIKNKSPTTIATPKLGPNIKVIRLHRKPIDGAGNTPKKVAKVLPSCTTPYDNKTGLLTSTPVFSRHAKRPQLPPPTVTKWRNCITPQRTYSRFKKKCIKPVETPGMLGRHQILIHHNDYVRPANTQGFYGEQFVQVRKVNTKIDLKTAISPNRFKAQLRNWSDITKTDEDEMLPKSKASFAHFSEGGSFNLLTHSTRNRCYGEKLQRLFRKRCVQKFKPTEQRYKSLVLPLEPLQREESRFCARRQLLI